MLKDLCGVRGKPVRDGRRRDLQLRTRSVEDEAGRPALLKVLEPDPCRLAGEHDAWDPAAVHLDEARSVERVRDVLVALYRLERAAREKSIAREAIGHAGD